jgi:hypothetical protein
MHEKMFKKCLVDDPRPIGGAILGLIHNLTICTFKNIFAFLMSF